MKIAVAEAKAQFAELIRRAEAGEEVEITRYGRPVARLVAPAPVPRRKRSDMFGVMKGQIWMAPDFNEMPPDLQAAFEGPITSEPMDETPEEPADSSAGDRAVAKATDPA